jgi:hypothetical protein
MKTGHGYFFENLCAKRQTEGVCALGVTITQVFMVICSIMGDRLVVVISNILELMVG